MRYRVTERNEESRIDVLDFLHLTGHDRTESDGRLERAPDRPWSARLQKVWPSRSAPPLERPGALAGRDRLTDEEVPSCLAAPSGYARTAGLAQGGNSRVPSLIIRD